MNETPALSAPAVSIMVVDPDAEECASIQRVLERGGWPTDTYPSGTQALAAARTTRPLLVLVEVCLPDISGHEVCRQLKDDYGEGIAVVFLSRDHTEPADEVAGLLLGADDYLKKPLRGSELLARVIAVLRGLGAIPERRTSPAVAFSP